MRLPGPSAENAVFAVSISLVVLLVASQVRPPEVLASQEPPPPVGQTAEVWHVRTAPPGENRPPDEPPAEADPIERFAGRQGGFDPGELRELLELTGFEG